MKTTTQKIKVRACQIINTACPDWGTFGVMEDFGTHYVILGDGGSRVLSKCEADKFWEVI